MILGLLLRRNKRKIVKIRGVDDHTYIDCTLYNNAYNISLVWISIKKYIYRQCLLVVIEKEVSKDCHKSTFLIRVIINQSQANTFKMESQNCILYFRTPCCNFTIFHAANLLLTFITLLTITICSNQEVPYKKSKNVIVGTPKICACGKNW